MILIKNGANSGANSCANFWTLKICANSCANSCANFGANSWPWADIVDTVCELERLSFENGLWCNLPKWR